MFCFSTAVCADPSKYPQFAQQKLPESIAPVFITVDELTKVLASVGKPLVPAIGI